MRSLTGLSVVLLLAAALAGCADAPTYMEPSQEPVTSTDPDTGNETVPETNETVEGNVTVDGNETVENAAPVASLVASAVNGTAPLNVTFTLDGSDADGDNLTWTFSINGTEIAAGMELPTEITHTFEAGNWSVVFVATDGDLSASQDLVVRVVAGEPAALVHQDAADDGLQFAEILTVAPEHDGEALKVVMTLESVWPSTDVLSAATYSIVVDGHLFNSFVRYAIDSNPMTWDDSSGAYMPAGTTVWTDSTVTFTLPVAHLESLGASAPFDVAVTANYGALNNREVMDAAPDSGFLVVS